MTVILQIDFAILASELSAMGTATLRVGREHQILALELTIWHQN